MRERLTRSNIRTLLPLARFKSPMSQQLQNQYAQAHTHTHTHTHSQKSFRFYEAFSFTVLLALPPADRTHFLSGRKPPHSPPHRDSVWGWPEIGCTTLQQEALLLAASGPLSLWKLKTMRSADKLSFGYNDAKLVIIFSRTAKISREFFYDSVLLAYLYAYLYITMPF